MMKVIQNVWSVFFFMVGLPIYFRPKLVVKTDNQFNQNIVVFEILLQATHTVNYTDCPSNMPVHTTIRRMGEKKLVRKWSVQKSMWGRR
jgi:hypothetical protein